MPDAGLQPDRIRSRRFVALWVAVWSGTLATQLALGAFVDASYHNPLLLFWFVLVAAGLCVVVALAVVVRAFREGRAESALLGSFLTTVSVLPLAHGFLVPGVICEPNAAVMSTVQLAVPVGGIALVPLLRRSGRLVRWRGFVVAHVAASFALAGVLVTFQDLVPAAATGSGWAVAAAGAALAISLGISIRHLRLAIISQHWHAMAVALGLAFVGSAPMIFVVGGVYSAAFWWAHVADTIGVLLAAGTAVVAFRRGATAEVVLAPIDGVTPLRSLEIGLDPLVHRFVADLDRHDPITRDHVVRTARMAVLVATELRLPPLAVRNVGIAAILHDVGKLEIPEEILTKPDRLTGAEYERIKTHTTIGAGLVEASPVLAPAAPYVRGHHERIDGRGYPDGLAGDAIPLGARIVAVCDAWDAMSHTRHYRSGMDHERVVAILREHQGAQWDIEVVDALLRVVGREPRLDEAPELDAVGRDHTLACYHDALPV